MKNYGYLLTEKNAAGNTVFVKERNGREFVYYATDGTFFSLCNPRPMTKDEVLAMQYFLTNVGVSGDKIYPVKDLNDRKVLPSGYTRCEKCGFVVRDDDIWCEDNGTYLCMDCHNSREED